MLWLNGASTIALTTSGDESASPTPSRPVSVRTRTRTESWLLAVFAWIFGMRRIWQMTWVIFMAVLRRVGRGFASPTIFKGWRFRWVSKTRPTLQNLCQHFLHHSPVYIRESEVAAGV